MSVAEGGNNTNFSVNERKTNGRIAARYLLPEEGGSERALDERDGVIAPAPLPDPLGGAAAAEAAGLTAPASEALLSPAVGSAAEELEGARDGAAAAAELVSIS